MDPANVREALRECEQDVAEGADVIMVKPALPYLDVIRAARDRFDLPLAAYNVSGEYAMVKAAAAQGWLEERQAALESLTAIKRAGADIVVSYWTKDLAVLALRTRSALWQRALELIPGGVNSPVRAMRAVGLDEPVFMRRGAGAEIEDVEGRRYVDWVMSWGPLIFGHADAETLAAVAEAAARRDELRSADRARGRARRGDRRRRSVGREGPPRLLGTEASMSAIRLARGFTRRDRVLKFAGCYHGHADALLASAGSGLATLGIPSSPGVPSGAAQDTIVCPYNDADAAAAAVAEWGEGLACVLVEPVAGNMGVVPPEPGFLETLRSLCDASGALLVFDEVITGFRVARGGAQERYGITPDLTILGKIVGGGLPLAAFGGRADVMDHLAPRATSTRRARSRGTRSRPRPGSRCCGGCATPRCTSGSRKTGARLEEGLAPYGRVQRVGAMLTLFARTSRCAGFEDVLAHGALRRAVPPSARARDLRGAVAVRGDVRLDSRTGTAEVDRTVEAVAGFFG